MPYATASDVEGMGRWLAYDARVAWTGLSDYPAFAKNVWRELARERLVAAGVTVVTEYVGPDAPNPPRFMD